MSKHPTIPEEESGRLLGAILLDQETFAVRLSAIVAERMSEKHRLILGAMATLHNEGKDIDVWTVCACLSQRGETGISDINMEMVSLVDLPTPEDMER